ncbi:hypothetical protein HanRHA438_Chr14g0678261 [Helianthus annuus]|nr:hypothetical protein HanRHA438_Chr14g0678261 [Helianthus annuus]
MTLSSLPLSMVLLLLLASLLTFILSAICTRSFSNLRFNRQNKKLTLSRLIFACHHHFHFHVHLNLQRMKNLEVGNQQIPPLMITSGNYHKTL